MLRHPCFKRNLLLFPNKKSLKFPANLYIILSL